MPDLQKMKDDVRDAKTAADNAERAARNNPTVANLQASVAAARNYANLSAQLARLLGDKCAESDGYLRLAYALRAEAASDLTPAAAKSRLRNEATDLERSAGELYLQCAADASAQGDLDRMVTALGNAGRAYGGLAATLRDLAEAGEVDWCSVADALYRAAMAIREQALNTTDPAEMITLLRQSNHAFDEAAYYFKKCGDKANDAGDYAGAADAYHKEAKSRDRQQEGERIVEKHYFNKQPRSSVDEFQAESAFKRRVKAGDEEEEALQREEKARRSYLETAMLAPDEISSG